jgi:hypothetical protein
MTITRTLTRDLSDRSRVVAHLELRLAPEGERFCENGLSPGFSATCCVYEPHGTWSGAARQRNGREPDGGGANHGQILRAFPELAPFVALHLSGPDGVPMHAESNGWYWYSSYDGRGTHNTHDGRTDYDVACDYLRLERGAIPCPQNRESFARLVDAQRERWAREAAEARMLLEALPNGDEQ